MYGSDQVKEFMKTKNQQKTYRVEIVECSTGKVVAIVGRQLNESQVNRRLETAVSRINTDKFFARDVKENG
jgi:hypothetical protein